MAQPERNRTAAALLALMVLIGLGVAAVLQLRHAPHGGGPDNGAVAIRPLAPGEAPREVQEAAAVLAPSRIAYAIAGRESTYLVISTGVGGQPFALDGARRRRSGDAGSDALLPGIDVRLTSASQGQRLMIAELKAVVADPRLLRFVLDGQAEGLPRLINPDGVPLVRLPDQGEAVLVAPAPGDRVQGADLEVAGFARMPGGQLTVRVLARAGKDLQPVGEVGSHYAAAAGPDWGSFRVRVPLGLEQAPGASEGLVWVAPRQSDGGARVPVKF